jgi:hypothetical protein
MPQVLQHRELLAVSCVESHIHTFEKLELATCEHLPLTEVIKGQLHGGEVGQGPCSHGRDQQLLHALSISCHFCKRPPVPPEELHHPRLLRGLEKS